MTWKSASVSVNLLVAICLLSGCASERDIRSRAMERFVREAYRNPLKGYSMKWPDEVVWKHHRNPDFDLLFDHVDGNSQILVTASRPLVRRDFPDGFIDMILDRLGAVQVSYGDRKDLTTETGPRFQITANASFRMFSREAFSVNRQLNIDVRSNGDYWLAVMFICNDIGTNRNLSDYTEIMQSVDWLADH